MPLNLAQKLMLIVALERRSNHLGLRFVYMTNFSQGLPDMKLFKRLLSLLQYVENVIPQSCLEYVTLIIQMNDLISFPYYNLARILIAINQMAIQMQKAGLGDLDKPS